MNVVYRGDRVRAEARGAYREVWLTRPEARNAVDVKLRDELVEVLGVLARDGSSGAVGVLGEGPDFCAGGDLREFGDVPDPVTGWHVRLRRSLPAAFLQLAPRLVVGVQGAAVGAGTELASFAARVIAADDARFRLPEVGMGLVPGSGGTVSVPARIGRHRTLEMLLTAEWTSAPEAHRQGLVDEVVPRARLVDRVREAAAT